MRLSVRIRRRCLAHGGSRTDPDSQRWQCGPGCPTPVSKIPPRGISTASRVWVPWPSTRDALARAR
eukprot:7022834-Pyramimonas_sp.AAC.1